MPRWEDFGGINLAYVEELYERYQRNPESLDPETRELLSALTPPAEAAGAVETLPVDAHIVVGAVNLAESIRRYGHLAARTDPLGTPPQGDPSLVPERH